MRAPCPTRVAGIGCRADVRIESVHALVRSVCSGARPLDGLVTLVERETVLAPVAAALGLRLELVPRAAIIGIATPTRSARLVRRFGTGSIAEALALLAAGEGARLTLTRVVSRDRGATIAVAETSS